MRRRWRDKREFKARVQEWAVKLDAKVTTIYVRPMRRKWASCSTAGNVNFNDELLELDRDLGEYVIVHELLHFSVPNHGKLWKSQMLAHLGDHERLATRLAKLSGRERLTQYSKPSAHDRVTAAPSLPKTETAHRMRKPSDEVWLSPRRCPNAKT